MRTATRKYLGMMLFALVIGAVMGVIVFLTVPFEWYLPVGIPIIVVVGIVVGGAYGRRM